MKRFAIIAAALLLFLSPPVIQVIWLNATAITVGDPKGDAGWILTAQDDRAGITLRLFLYDDVHGTAAREMGGDSVYLLGCLTFGADACVTVTADGAISPNSTIRAHFICQSDDTGQIVTNIAKGMFFTPPDIGRLTISRPDTGAADVVFDHASVTRFGGTATCGGGVLARATLPHMHEV